MFRFHFTDDFKNACRMYFSVYGIDISNYDLIKEFLIERFKTRDIEVGYNSGFITVDEVCSFIMSNLYTKFIINATSNKNPSEVELESSSRAITEALKKMD